MMGIRKFLPGDGILGEGGKRKKYSQTLILTLQNWIGEMQFDIEKGFKYDIFELIELPDFFFK